MSLADEVKLDWVPRHDPRSLRFTIAEHFNTAVPLRKRAWSRKAFLDQSPEPGYDGSGCTGFALAHVIGSTPRYRSVTRADAIDYYHGAQRNDEYAGEAYEGSSVLGACQYAVGLGLTSAYYWARSVEEVAHGISQSGPIDVGTNWYPSMFDVAADGFVHLDPGAVAGGHSYVLGAVDPTAETFTIWQSWRQWAGMSAQIHWADFARLLAEGGEAALVKKVKAP